MENIPRFDKNQSYTMASENSVKTESLSKSDFSLELFHTNKYKSETPYIMHFIRKGRFKRNLQMMKRKVNDTDYSRIEAECTDYIQKFIHDLNKTEEDRRYVDDSRKEFKRLIIKEAHRYCMQVLQRSRRSLDLSAEVYLNHELSNSKQASYLHEDNLIKDNLYRTKHGKVNKSNPETPVSPDSSLYNKSVNPLSSNNNNNYINTNNDNNNNNTSNYQTVNSYTQNDTDILNSIFNFLEKSYTKSNQPPIYDLSSDTIKNYLDTETKLAPSEMPHESSGFYKTYFIPPTGPDGTNYQESIHTSQQTTYSVGQIMKPVCFYLPQKCQFMNNGEAPTPEIICFRRPYGRNYINSNAVSQYLKPNQPISENQDNTNSQEDPIKSLDNLSPTALPSTAAPLNPSVMPGQSVILTPTVNPFIHGVHLPTAISSPNPYFFPTYSGYQVSPEFPIHNSVSLLSQNINPKYQSQQSYIPQNDYPNVFPIMSPPPQAQGMLQPPPFYYVPGTNNKPYTWHFPTHLVPYSVQVPKFYPPQVQTQTMLPGQAQKDLYCIYLPSPTYQSPVVPGVIEVRQKSESSVGVDNADNLEYSSTNETSGQMAKMNTGNIILY